ncbi:MAG: hypothetical protein LBK24_03405 [Puniceicoccales bacterium]|jgi:hypothetical protein|nr:hypothetical protein [Puniceicoccales bacterium]
MKIWSKGEIGLTFFKYEDNGGGITLPAGRLLISGPKFSFFSKENRKIYGYELDAKGNVAGYYVNGKRVSWKAWKVEMAKYEDLKNSNFGQKSFYGMKSLVSREASRFLKGEDLSHQPKR